MTSKYRGPAHSKCNINVTQDQSNFKPILFRNFSNCDCHMFFKKLVDLKNDEVKFDIIPKTNEEYISVTYDYQKKRNLSFNILNAKNNNKIEITC